MAAPKSIQITANGNGKDLGNSYATSVPGYLEAGAENWTSRTTSRGTSFAE